MSYRKDGQIDIRKMPKIVYRPLGKEQAFGLSHHVLSDGTTPVEPTIEIDATLTGRKKLEIEIHEALHLVQPALTEEGVLRSSRYLSMLLWQLGYRQPTSIV